MRIITEDGARVSIRETDSADLPGEAEGNRIVITALDGEVTQATAG